MMKGPRCGGLGSKVSRCCGGSQLRNLSPAVHNFSPPGAGRDVENQPNDLAFESERLPNWSGRHQGPSDRFPRSGFGKFFEPVSKTVDVRRCGRCLKTFKHIRCVGRIHFALRDSSARNFS